MAWLNSLLLKSPNPRVRCKAVDNLSRSTRPSDTELLFATLNDESPQVRCAAVRALARTNTADSINSLVGALRDPHCEVREASARALGRLRSVAAAEPLARCLRDADAAVRIAVAAALRAIGWKPATREQLAWFEFALGNTPAGAAPENAQEASSSVPNRDTSFYRQMEAAAEKESSAPSRIKSLLEALHGCDLLARVAAIHDLSRAGDPKITHELLKLFRDPEKEIRLAAAQALGSRQDTPAAHFLSLLQDSHFEVRVAAVQFLGRIRHEYSVDVLSPLLGDPDVRVRQATARALGQIRSPSAIEALLCNLSDADEPTREALERVLDDVQPGWRQPAQSSTCIPSSTTRLAGIR